VRVGTKAEFDVDCIVLPADDTTTINESVKRRLPVLVFGSHFFLRQAYLAGCSDFCKDPWTLGELELRLDAIVSGIIKRHRFSWGEIELSGGTARVGGNEIGLSWHEVSILRVLLEQCPAVVPREVLFYAIRGKPGEEGSRVIDVHVSSLRKKLKPFVPDDGPLIASVRGMGYMIDRT
jgi:DNA-binding response OmpR family regulator